MKRWLVNVISSFNRFMRYRNGHDQLNNFLMVLYIVVVMVRFFVGNETVSIVLYFITQLVLVVIIFRFLSKKKVQRSRENHHYLNIKFHLKAWFSKTTRRSRDMKDYKYFKCPNCSQQLRVPRGRGKIDVTCPKCHTKFERKS